MSARLTSLAALLLAAAALGACRDDPASEAADGGVITGRPIVLVPSSGLQAGPQTFTASLTNPLEGDERAIGEGKRLFGWYNCAGCHGGAGGGGMGPPFVDADWIYGSDPGSIYQSIVQGRPNGMPAFGTMVPEEQVWQIVTFIRSLGGVQQQSAARAGGAGPATNAGANRR